MAVEPLVARDAEMTPPIATSHPSQARAALNYTVNLLLLYHSWIQRPPNTRGGKYGRRLRKQVCITQERHMLT